MTYTILVIEDEASQLRALTGFLKKHGHKIFWSSSGLEGLRMAQAEAIDLVLTDYRMPDKNGLEVLKEIKQINPQIDVILMTAHGNVEMAVEAMKAGAFDYLTKPLELDELEIIVNRALERKRLISENQQLRLQLQERYRFDEIISGSAEMEKVINAAGRAAGSKTTVLIRGESGTGKEIIARTIHYASPRRSHPFIAINCAALSENLLESECFGHEKGAFTGADKQRKGRFEQADGGTLFIDEIGDIPASTQVKLLRVLQEREFERVGGNETIQVDVRVIAATNRDLEKMIEVGDFREDLFYRVNVIPIIIPPLRERKSDIPLLASYFISQYANENNRNIEGLSKEAIDVLMRYDYPGNVRELENAIESAVVMARGTLLMTDDLPVHIKGARSEQDITRTDIAGKSLPEMVEELERRLITNAIKKADGNQSKASKALGINERNLRYKLKKYGMKN